jgi:hypothetical protein
VTECTGNTDDNFLITYKLRIYNAKGNYHAAKEKKVDVAYFIGTVTIREVLSEQNSREQEMYQCNISKWRTNQLGFA